MIADAAANSRAYLSHFARTSLVDFHDDGELVSISSRLPVAPFNCVFRTRSERGLRMRIRMRVAMSRACRAPLLWWIDPGAGPAILPALLEAEGLKALDPARVMMADLSTWPGKGTAGGDRRADGDGDGLTIEPVRAAGALDDWARVLGASQAQGPAAGAAWRAIAGELGVAPDAPLQHVVARRGGEAIGCASTFTAGGVVGLYNVAVVPEARRRGVATALSRAALGTARSQGYRKAVLGSRPAAVGVYRRLGFEDAGRVQIYMASS